MYTWTPFIFWKNIKIAVAKCRLAVQCALPILLLLCRLLLSSNINMKTVGERCPVINVIWSQKSYSTIPLFLTRRTGDVTSHCGVLNPGPCPEVWAELVLTTQEENSLFGSAIHKAIGTVSAISFPHTVFLSYSILSFLYFIFTNTWFFSSISKASARVASKFDFFTPLS